MGLRLLVKNGHSGVKEGSASETSIRFKMLGVRCKEDTAMIPMIL